jgi:predicted CopG family antitoxin
MERHGKRSLRERGFRLIVVSSDVYDKLMELKGDRSFNQFIRELISIYTAGPKERSVYIQAEKKAEAKPSIVEYRSHLCRDCSLDAKAVEDCRIRQYQYAIHGLKCPRQL